MGGSHLSTWISAEAKQRFTSAAVRQGLSASAFLKRLVEQVLAGGGGDEALPSTPIQIRGARVTVRLVPEDHALLCERATARTMPAATYISTLVRAHLRQLAPLPDRELVALQSAVNELVAVGRNLNAIAHLMHRGGSQTGPSGGELQMLLRVCEALRDHVRALIKVNLVSWQVGHDSRNN